jgi:hypothetical protein
MFARSYYFDARYLIFLLYFFHSVVFARPPVSDENIALFQGEYRGTQGEVTWSGCRSPESNGQYVPSRVTVVFSLSDSGHLTGQGIFRGNEGANVGEDRPLFHHISGMQKGEITGVFESNFYLNGYLDSRGHGSFVARKVRNSLSLNFQGVDDMGDTCQFVGEATLFVIGNLD